MKSVFLICAGIMFFAGPRAAAQHVSKKSDLCACTDVHREVVTSSQLWYDGYPYQVTNTSYHRIEIVAKEFHWPVFPVPLEVCSNAFVKRVKHANEELTKSHYPTYEIETVTH